MSIGLLFWVIMVVWFVFGLFSTPLTVKGSGGFLLQWILFTLLGWAVFGAAIHK